ncbi:MAG TPA: HAMP domain-containing sensor histidine kinase [Terriglobia bacterium]|nr:HAMP domain-containing sensor histidine kinase [Terriglobia bacterium]
MSGIRSLQRFAGALSPAQTAEQVYSFGLTAIQEIFEPDSAFVLLPDSSVEAPRPIADHDAGPVTDLTIPVILDGGCVAQFLLHFNKPALFADTDFALAGLAAAQTAHALAQVRERERMKQAARRKHESIAMAVHELRSPLTAIIGATFLLRSEKEKAKAIEIISRNAKAQARLIDDLLKLSQVDAGRLKLQLSILDLVPIITQVVDDIQPTASANGVSVETQLPAPIMICGESRRLSQIFWNLASNSLRFSSNGGRIRVTAEKEDGFARICVTDDGCGIKQDRLPYIFDRFEQAHEPGTQRYDGLGLGLAIVKEFVTLHGGTIAADSAGSGLGSTFTLQFPLAIRT